MSVMLSLLSLGMTLAMSLEAIPHSPGSHYAFVAELDRESPAAILMLGNDGLHVYPQGQAQAAWHVPLDAEVTAFDLYDLDADHRLDAIWIKGAAVYSRAMMPEAVAEVLFDIAPTALPDGPFPQVLAHDTGDGLRIIVPGQKALFEYGLDGTLHREHPLDAQTSGHAMLGVPFRAWTPLQPMAGATDGLEIHATRVQALKPALEDFATALDPAFVARRNPTPQQLVEAAKQDSIYWPWFPLEQGPEEARPFAASRVYYAVDGSGGASETLVRIWSRGRATEPDGGEGPMVLGPERRYPGIVLPPTEAGPDFNGDGYSDLMTWRAPQPAPTADSLARAITRGTWTATLSVHLYAPESERFHPRAAARLEVELPINWFLSGLAPFQLLRTEDLTGNGRSELIFALAEDRLGVWRLTGDRFEGLHGEGLRVAEALQRHIATAPPKGQHGALALFAGEEKYWVLRMPSKTR